MGRIELSEPCFSRWGSPAQPGWRGRAGGGGLSLLEEGPWAEPGGERRWCAVGGVRAAVGLWPPPPAAVATGTVGDAGLGRRVESVMFTVAEKASRQPCSWPSLSLRSGSGGGVTLHLTTESPVPASCHSQTPAWDRCPPPHPGLWPVALWWVPHAGCGQWSPQVSRARPVNALLFPGPAASEVTTLPGKGSRRGPGYAVSLRSSSVLSPATGWESPGQQKSPGVSLAGAPPPVSTEPGLSQASQSRNRICFPRKDAERDGQIELGVPGIQTHEFL